MADTAKEIVERLRVRAEYLSSEYDKRGDSITVLLDEVYVFDAVCRLDEAAALIEQLVADLDDAESTQALMARDWHQFCEAMGVRFDTHEAVACDLNVKGEAAVLAEREACAEIADKHTCGACGMDGTIAAAIRARSTHA